MAASVALTPDLRLEASYKIQNPIRLCPTVPVLSHLPSGLMAQSPPMNDYRGSNLSHKPRLPSFSNFLSGTGCPDLNFAQPRPGSSRGDFLPVNHETLNRPAATQSTAWPTPDRLPPPLPDFGPRAHERHVEQSQAQFWPYSSSAASDRTPAAVGVCPPGPPLDRVHGRTNVREELVPGKGPCYLYDDGTSSQKTGDGDAVNPKWGTTKAGKPRKRLGQACNTCREKKIKCDPSVPKCAQCKKFGRECKFDSGPRTGQKRASSIPSAYSSSYSSPVEQMSDRLPLRRESTASTELKGQESPLSRPGNRSSLPLESLLSPTSPGHDADEDGLARKPPTKRARTARLSASPPPGSEGGLSDGFGVDSLSNPASWPVSMHAFSWEADPCEVHRGLTLYYVGKCLSHVDSKAYCTLPRKKFTSWVENCCAKSLEDKMLLYAILALGTVFARRAGRDAHRSAFLSIVHDAILKGGDRLSLQLIQTRLILASLSFSQGEYNRAWDFCGAALRTAFGLGYNTEEGVHTVSDPEHLDFGLDLTTLIECRRRTFWSAYIMNCFGGCTSASVGSMYSSECHLRLPCSQDAYEAGKIPVTAFDLNHSGGSADARELSRQVAHVGLFGYLVQIATIFQEVVSKSSRPRSQADNNYRATVETFRHEVMRKLHSWYRQLRTHLKRASNDHSNAEPVNGLHIFYHYTALVLHRHVRHAELGPQQVNIHVQGAYDHARLMLEIVQRLSNNNEERDAALFRFTTTSPFSGYAITSALDTITAAGILSEAMDHKSRTMSLISSGLEALESLMEFWHSAHQQRDMIKQRLKTLLNASKSASDYNGAFYFAKPMQSPFGLDQDIVYGLARMRYFEALGWHHKIHHRGDFHQLDQE